MVVSGWLDNLFLPGCVYGLFGPISEPDLPFVAIKEVVSEITIDASAMPYAVETILITGGVLPQDAKFFTADAVRSKTFMTINNAVQDASFVAKTLVNNMDADAYEQVDNIADLIEIFQLFKADKITSVLVQNGITSYLKDSSFDYKKYFDENTISKDKITAAIAKVVLENKAIVNEIKECLTCSS